MNTTASKEYSVLVTPPLVNGSNGHTGFWQATVMGLPDIVETAVSRHEVIQQVEQRLTDVMRHSEIISLTVPAPPAPARTIKDGEDRLRALGWDDHGLFKGDLEALKLFDEIEEERNRHWVGGE